MHKARDIREFFVTKQTRRCPKATRTDKIVTHIKQTGLNFQQKYFRFFLVLEIKHVGLRRPPR